jgi:hypothetical protein
VEVLRAAADLRSEGLAGSQLDARLGDLTIPDVVESAQDVAQATQTAQDATERTALVPIALYAAERARWDQERREYQQRIEELQRELGRMEGQRKRPAWWVRLFGA